MIPKVSYLISNSNKKMIYKVQDHKNKTFYFITTFEKIMPLVKANLIKASFEVFEINEL